MRKTEQRPGSMLVIIHRLRRAGVTKEKEVCKQRFEGREGVRYVDICGE